MKKLFVLSAPSGAGKNTVANEILKSFSQLKETTSCTTRTPRPGEASGVHYYFISVADFERKIKQGEFLEYAQVHDNYYGTLKSNVEELWKQGYDVLAILDVQGYEQIQKVFKDIIGIFIAPPSLEVLKARLISRGSEEGETLAKRLKNAEWEMSKKDHYQHIVINDRLEQTLAEVKAIFEFHLNRG